VGIDQSASASSGRCSSVVIRGDVDAIGRLPIQSGCGVLPR
jgi:hypothetical protein